MKITAPTWLWLVFIVCGVFMCGAAGVLFARLGALLVQAGGQP
jgi:hypothetical protein